MYFFAKNTGIFVLKNLKTRYRLYTSNSLLYARGGQPAAHEKRMRSFIQNVVVAITACVSGLKI